MTAAPDPKHCMLCRALASTALEGTKGAAEPKVKELAKKVRTPQVAVQVATQIAAQIATLWHAH